MTERANEMGTQSQIPQTPRPIVISTPAEQRSSGMVAAMRMAAYAEAAKHPGWLLQKQATSAE